MSVPYSPITAMAKTNCRKRSNRFATKNGKGREVWMDIFGFLPCFSKICKYFVSVMYTCNRAEAGWGEGYERRSEGSGSYLEGC